MFRVKVRLSLEPGLSPRGDVGPILLAHVRRFFNGHRMTIEKSPDRTRRKGRPMLFPQQHRKLNQCHIHLALDRSQYDIAMRFNPTRPLIPTLRPGSGHTSFPPLPNPPHRTGSRYAKSLGRCPSRQSSFNRRNNASPQVFG
jgi:hypothetical protein